MGFVSEEILREEDKKLFLSMGLKDIFGKPAEPYWWAIDRDRNIVLYPRGGGAFEVPVGYGLSIEGKQIEMEVEKKTKGDIFDHNLEIHWVIQRIVVPDELMLKGYTYETVVNLVEDAFAALGTTGIEREKLVDVTVKIEGKPMLKSEAR